MENITYIKSLLLPVIEFQNSRFSFAVIKLFLIPSAFAFCPSCKAEGKGEEWKTFTNSTCHHCNVQCPT